MVAVRINHQVVVFDAAELSTESSFRAAGDSADNFQVYADPAGHPFCLCWVAKAQS